MLNTLGFLENDTKDKRNLSIAILIILLVSASWLGSLDDYSTEYTNETIIGAGTVYAIARGVNAIVSVLQSSTIEGGFIVASGSITIGEILDPVNDLIERFSSIMSFSLASLVLQKILLAIASNDLFKVLISVFGIGSLICLPTAKGLLRRWFFRCFTVMAFLRFSLVIVVLLNMQVDKIFLSKAIEDGTESLSSMRTEMTALGTNVKTVERRRVLKDDIKKSRLHRRAIETKLLPPLGIALTKADVSVFEAEETISKLAKNESWNPLKKSSAMILAEEHLEAEKTKRSKIQREISDFKKDIESFRISVEAHEIELLAGSENGPEDLLAIVRNYTEKLNWSSIESMVSDYVKIVTDLIVLFLLKTVIIPVLFLYCLIKGAKSIWIEIK